MNPKTVYGSDTLIGVTVVSGMLGPRVGPYSFLGGFYSLTLSSQKDPLLISRLLLGLVVLVRISGLHV